MKILCIVSTLDFRYKMGTVPIMWQLPKALHEIGHTVTLSTYLGQAIESPWWKAYPNPCQIESQIYNWYLDRTTTRSVGEGGVISKISKAAIRNYVYPKWLKTIMHLCETERPDCVLFMLIPLGHIAGIASEIRARFGIPVLFFDGDLPSSLTNAKSKMFKFSMYKDADISEYDCFLSCSKGILPELMKLGARRAEVLYYAADPSIFSSLEETEKGIDVFYYGHRGVGKEKQFDYMMAEASRAMPKKLFVVGGVEHTYEFGNCESIGRLSLGEWRYWCANSKINLNITKDTDSCIYGSSSARPFELGAMGCCMVSDPYLGMEEWFQSNEVWQVGNVEEAVSSYKTLLQDDRQMGKLALKRVLEEHTYKHRAKRLEEIIRSL